MSYILDALNRSNAESVQDPAALLAQPRPHPGSRRAIPVLLAMLLAVNVCLGGWWLWQQSDTRAAGSDRAQTSASALRSPQDLPTTPAGAEPTAIPAESTQAAAGQPRTSGGNDANAQPRSGTQSISRADGAAESTPPARLSSKPRNQVELAAGEELITPASTVVPVSIGALPRGIQEQIPNLTFSSHIFAEDPAVRMVNINGELYREGDTIARGVKLLKITEAGAVLSYLHYTFAVGVLEDWAL